MARLSEAIKNDAAQPEKIPETDQKSQKKAVYSQAIATPSGAMKCDVNRDAFFAKRANGINSKSNSIYNTNTTIQDCDTVLQLPGGFELVSPAGDPVAGPEPTGEALAEQLELTELDRVFLVLPLTRDPRKTGYPVTYGLMKTLAPLYPAVDMEQAVREMLGWCLGHPKELKTRRGIMAFITGWLQRAQNEGGHVRKERRNSGTTNTPRNGSEGLSKGGGGNVPIFT